MFREPSFFNWRTLQLLIVMLALLVYSGIELSQQEQSSAGPSFQQPAGKQINSSRN